MMKSYYDPNTQIIDEEENEDENENNVVENAIEAIVDGN